MDSSDDLPDPAQTCEKVVREQIDILYRYKERVVALDPGFVASHALMIVQLCDEMTAPSREEGPRRPLP